MPKIRNLVISAGRKLSLKDQSGSYLSREAEFTVTVDLDEGDSARDVLNEWARKLTMACDRTVGDDEGWTSFAKVTGYQAPFPALAAPVEGTNQG